MFDRRSPRKGKQRPSEEPYETQPMPPSRPPAYPPRQQPPSQPRPYPPSNPGGYPQRTPPAYPPANPGGYPPQAPPGGGYPPPYPQGPNPQYPPPQAPGPQRPAPPRQPKVPVARPRRNPPFSHSGRRGCGCGCLPMLGLLGVLALVLAVFLFAPFRTNVLLLGIDYTEPGSYLGRSDTIILTTFQPALPYVGMLSIPRDLWVTIPGYGENRINTAHFFAEGTQPGSGPAAALETVRSNFGVDVKYYVRIRFEGFRDVFNAMGGVDITLDEPMAGYEAGRHHLTGNKALAFARNRSGSDDFFRMERGQLLMKAAVRQMLNPLKWPRIPGVLLAMNRAIDTNLPVFLWPRLGAAVLRTGPDGIDNRTIRREMVVPFTTSEGANVLLPDWNQINPVLLDMFDQ